VSGPQQAAASGWRWLWLTALVIALDQLSKWLVVRHMALYETIELLPVLNLYRTFNLGAAFSFLHDAGGWQRWFFIALGLGVGVAIVIWLRKLHWRTQALLSCSLSLILGGAIGNVIDRIRLGHVVDFIHAHWKDADFPAFNIADSAITVGAILLLIDAFRESRRAKRVNAS
jgi:signal peptidase II